MKPYLDAHDAFVAWMEGTAECEPTAAEVDEKLWALALYAAHRGMSDVHWTFVVDGLIAHAKRRCPANVALPDYIARGFDLSTRWDSVKAAASERLH